MAVLKADVEFNTRGFQKLLTAFPAINSDFLRFVGGTARKHLKQQYLSGQEIDLRAYPRDKKGKYTVRSSINKKRTYTMISSYPMNLFERGRELRSGEREAGKYVITRKLKRDMEGRLNVFARRYESEFLTGAIKKMGLS